MRDERDPQLQALFAEADTELDAGLFAESVMMELRRRNRRRLIGWIVFDIALVALLWVFAAPLTELVYSLVPILSQVLVPLDNPQLAELAQPVNNIAALLGLIALMLRSIYRRMLG